LASATAWSSAVSDFSRPIMPVGAGAVVISQFPAV